MSEREGLVYETVLITGASGGIGEEFARQLVHRCKQVVLVARREDRLRELAADLRGENADLDVLYYVVDLTVSEERVRLLETLSDGGVRPDLLVNNAGMGDYLLFADSDRSKIDRMMQLNMVALTDLTHGVIAGMRERGGGAIINVSSLASVLPMPEFAVYAATKAYVTSFSEALRLELAEDGISVSALCPGPVHTEFGSVAMPADARELPGREQFYVDKSLVVSESLLGVEGNKARVYPGWKVKLVGWGVSLLPMPVVRLVMRLRLADGAERCD